MICYYFPPIRSSAVARTLGFAKNITKFGFEPKILTVKAPRDSWGIISMDEPIPKNMSIDRVYEFSFLKIIELLDAVIYKLLKLLRINIKSHYLRNLICIPDGQLAWIPIFKGVSLAKECECIYVSCSPYSTAVFACIIKIITKRKLIIDYRDAWTISLHNKISSKFNLFFSQYLEMFVLRTCDALILNTEGTLAAYKTIYKKHAHKMVCIPNGYDEFKHENVKITDTKFVIMYVGTFYGNRVPDLLFDALNELDFRNDVKFVYIGRDDGSLDKFRGLFDIDILGPVCNSEVISWLLKASLLYLKQGDGSGLYDNTAVAAKTYEYLYSGVPMLCECPDGDNKNMVRKYSNNSYILESNTKDEMKRLLSKAYFEKTNSIEVNEEFLEKYNRVSLTEELVKLINNVCDK